MPKPVDPAIAFLDSLREEYPEEFSPETALSRRKQFYRDNNDEIERLEVELREPEASPTDDPYERTETV